MKISLLAIFLLPLAASSIWADTRPLELDAGKSALYLQGDSTLHAYASTASILNVTASLETTEAADRTLAQILAGATAQLELRIPVSGLKSGKGSLDKNMLSALKGDKHADIVFVLDSLSAGGEASAQGRLSVAGVERPIELRAELNATERAVRVQGRHDLLMSDFGIKPPAMMLGTLKTKDAVVIHFDLTLTEKTTLKGGVHENR